MGCGSSSATATNAGGSGAAESATPLSSGPSFEASEGAGESASPSPSVKPTPKPSSSAKPGVTPKPTPAATPTPGDGTPPPADSPAPTDTATPTASAAADIGPGAICSGSTENKQFWTSAAAQLMWDVYCPVLPGGWYVIDGSYTLTNGGTLDISFKGPGGAQIHLQEGSFCTSGLSACQPHDQVLGTASFGDRSGSLDTLGPDMGYAIYIDPGSSPSWAISGTGMDQASFAAIAAALVKVPKS